MADVMAVRMVDLMAVKMVGYSVALMDDLMVCKMAVKMAV